MSIESSIHVRHLLAWHSKCLKDCPYVAVKLSSICEIAVVRGGKAKMGIDEGDSQMKKTMHFIMHFCGIAFEAVIFYMVGFALASIGIVA